MKWFYTHSTTWSILQVKYQLLSFILKKQTHYMTHYPELQRLFDIEERLTLVLNYMLYNTIHIKTVRCLSIVEF